VMSDPFRKPQDRVEIHIGEWAGTVIVVVLLVCLTFVVVAMCEESPPQCPCQCEQLKEESGDSTRNTGD